MSACVCDIITVWIHTIRKLTAASLFMSVPSVNRWTGECFSYFGRTNHRLHPNSLYPARETSSPVQVSTELTLRVIFHPGSWTFVASCSTEQLSSGELTSDALSDFSCCPRQKHLSFLFVVMQLNLTVVKSAGWSAHTCVSLSLSVSLRYSLFKCPSRTLRIIKTNWEQNTTSSQFQWSGFSLSSTCWRDGHHQVWLRVSGPVHPGGAGQSWGQNLSSSSTPNFENHFVIEIIYSWNVSVVTLQTLLINQSRGDSCAFGHSYFRPYWIKLLSNTDKTHQQSETNESRKDQK